MSALALILAKRGYSVSGSDPAINQSFQKLQSAGVIIFKIQSATNIKTICSGKTFKPLIVISTAIPATNPELQAAEQANLEIWHRSDLLAELIENQPSIVVGGSHGKTTTSTIITTLLALTNNDPTAIIGGIVPYYKSNGHAGRGEVLIAEGDESDGTIDKFNSDLGVITNIELDHTNHYSDIWSLIKTMKKFANNSKKLLANKDCDITRENITALKWWSTKTIKDIDYACIPINLNGRETTANYYEEGKLIDKIKIPLPGMHNLSNATAAIAACRIAGISFQELKENLPYIQTPKRRFEFRGTWRNRQFVDDYAHHPSEISATISMARLMINSKHHNLNNSAKRLLVIFQPHRYSRTKDFQYEFAKVLLKADLVIIAPIYSAGEQRVKGIDNQSIETCAKQINPNFPISSANNFEELIKLIQIHTLKDDLILNMGAGNINSLWDKLTALNLESDSDELNVAA